MPYAIRELHLSLYPHTASGNPSVQFADSALLLSLLTHEDVKTAQNIRWRLKDLKIIHKPTINNIERTPYFYGVLFFFMPTNYEQTSPRRTLVRLRFHPSGSVCPF